MQTIASELAHFYRSLRIGCNLPKGVELLYPQADEKVMAVVSNFLHRYFADQHPRQMIFGINPGRFGAGTTGINFTGPKQLTESLQMEHPFGKKSELSAEFIYEVITGYGGAEKFYRHFFLSAISPLGFTKNGKNLNYYDDKELEQALEPFITKSIAQQLRIFRPSQICICIGGEKNFNYFLALNSKKQFFKEIIPLAHPRFIMQYRRKQKEKYLLEYLSALERLRF
jgi:hypothetical protein